MPLPVTKIDLPASRPAPASSARGFRDTQLIELATRPTGLFDVLMKRRVLFEYM